MPYTCHHFMVQMELFFALLFFGPHVGFGCRNWVVIWNNASGPGNCTCESNNVHFLKVWSFWPWHFSLCSGLNNVFDSTLTFWPYTTFDCRSGMAYLCNILGPAFSAHARNGPYFPNKLAFQTKHLSFCNICFECTVGQVGHDWASTYAYSGTVILYNLKFYLMIGNKCQRSKHSWLCNDVVLTITWLLEIVLHVSNVLHKWFHLLPEVHAMCSTEKCRFVGKEIQKTDESKEVYLLRFHQDNFIFINVAHMVTLNSHSK